jgi:dUTPase
VIIQATGAGNAPQIVTVNLTVIDPTAPQLTATPSSLTFTYIIGTPPPEAQSIAIGTSGSALSYTVSAYGLWLAVAVPSGATPGSASISVDPTGLAAGTYTGSVNIAAEGAGNTLIVPVSLNVVKRSPSRPLRSSLAVTAAATVPNLTVSPMTLSFTYQIGGAVPAAQTVLPVASDGSALSYTASASGDSWLTALPVNGTTPGSVSVSISPQALAAGVYTGHVIVTSVGAANLPQVVTVSLTVVGSPVPTLTATPASLAFSYQAGGPAPPWQALTIGSSGSVLRYTVSASGDAWLGVTPTSGNTLDSVGVFVNTSGLAVGTYSGSISIVAAGAGNTPLTVPVTLTVTLGNIFTTLYSANFYYIIGNNVQSLPNISIGSTGSALSYTVLAPSWLAVTPTSGTTPGSLSVSINTTGLTAGTYSGSVTIAAANAGNSPLTVPENLTVVNPSIVPSQSSLTFTYATGGTAPSAQSLSISSNGAALSYTVSASGGTWLSMTPTSGTTPGSVSVSVNTTGLAVGTYSGSVTIAAAGAANTPVTVPVTLRVTLPALTTTPSSLTFSYTTGGTAPAAPSVSITSNGSALSYTVSASGGTWLVVTPTSGMTPGSVTVSINTTGLTAGTYTGSVTITSSGASNSPRTVTVTLTVT